ncbi:MAG: ribonuclease R [Pseudomonadota bacterium]
MAKGKKGRSGKSAQSGRDASKGANKVMKKGARKGTPKAGRDAVTEDELLAVLRKGPLTLVQLGQRLDAVSGIRRRTLMVTLKSALKRDLIQHDGDGVYGLVTRRVRHRRAQDAEPKSPTQLAAEASIDQTTATGINAVGLLHTKVRYPYVEVVSGPQRGRINLEGPVPRTYREGDTVTVHVLGEDRYGLRGTLTGRVARGGGVAQASETLLATHDVPREWPAGMAAVVERLPKQVNASTLAGGVREDLRELPLVTIDGETARDFDDAVYAEAQGKGSRLVVAIADVAHYVKRGSLLDDEAQLRGNSVYLPDRVVPMLPEALSNGLCSLRPQENRLALVCDMRVSAQGRVTRFQFYDALIRSWARLTYTDVGAFLEDPSAALPVPEPVRDSLSQLHAVYGALRGEREQRGALDFEGRDARIEIENDAAVAIHPVVRNDAHKLIEEAMIAANVCAARFLEGAEVPGMYRVHEPPPEEKLEQLRQVLATAGLKLPEGIPTPKTVQQAVTGLKQRADASFLESMVLRSLSQACYAPKNAGHFGLALKRYMHFTSPIRRYADLIVHRAIKAVLKLTPEQRATELPPPSRMPRGAAVYDLAALEDLGVQLSQTERRADEVSWGVDAWLKCEYMAQFVGQDLSGTVTGVAEFGLFVELDGAFVQGLVHVSTLGSDYFQYQPLDQSLVGERSGKRFRLGDRMQVTLTSVDPPRGRMGLVPAGHAQRSRGRRR